METDVFWNLVRTYDVSGYEFMQGCPDGEHRLEGFLFPDTYFVMQIGIVFRLIFIIGKTQLGLPFRHGVQNCGVTLHQHGVGQV